jgi:hypothetical protein
MMGLLDDVKNAISQYTSGSGSADDLAAQFHKVAGSTDPNVLSQGIAAALRSDQTPPFGQLVSQLFANASADQKAGMLNALLGAASPDTRAKLAGLLPGIGAGAISGGQTAAISPDLVNSVAQQMEQHNPGVVDKMGSFYSQHPTLVRTLGAAAMMVVLRKIAEHHA